MERTNVFAMNMQSADENKVDGHKFLIRVLDKETEEKREELDADFSSHEKKAALPLWLRVIEWIGFLFGLIFLAGFFKALADVSFATAWKNGGAFLIVGALFLTVSIVLNAVEKKRGEAVVASEEFQADTQEADALRKEILEKINVPSTAKKVDVFGYPYKEKHGKLKDAGMMAKYINIELLLFREGNELCLADVGSVYAFPLDKIDKIVKINKRVTTTGWNKEIGYKEGEYKQYKITENQYGTLFVKPYYSVRFSSEGLEYEILVPCYDIQPFLDVLQISPVQEENAQKGEKI